MLTAREFKCLRYLNNYFDLPSTDEFLETVGLQRSLNEANLKDISEKLKEAYEVVVGNVATSKSEIMQAVVVGESKLPDSKITKEREIGFQP